MRRDSSTAPTSETTASFSSFTWFLLSSSGCWSVWRRVTDDGLQLQRSLGLFQLGSQQFFVGQGHSVLGSHDFVGQPFQRIVCHRFVFFRTQDQSDRGIFSGVRPILTGVIQICFWTAGFAGRTGWRSADPVGAPANRPAMLPFRKIAEPVDRRSPAASHSATTAAGTVGPIARLLSVTFLARLMILPTLLAKLGQWSFEDALWLRQILPAVLAKSLGTPDGNPSSVRDSATKTPNRIEWSGQRPAA